MNSRHRRIFIWTISTVAALAAVWMFLAAGIRRAHSGFALLQLESFYEESLAGGQAPVTTRDEFLARVRQWNMDWNSCRFDGATIRDSWKTPIEIQVTPSHIDIRSAGPDRQFGSADDFTRSIPHERRRRSCP